MTERSFQPLRVAVVGCGLIGEKRAKALGGKGSLVACVDSDQMRADRLSGQYPQAKSFTDWRAITDCKGIDVVVVATLHDSLAEITKAAVEEGKHVLVEKPAARHTSEINMVLDSLNASTAKVHVGFNHRYHRALRKAKELVDAGVLGELMFIRGRYGHGGRLGYNREWRANPALSGGGELMDQGPHLIDLARWLMGDFTKVQGVANTYFWDMPVDDNGFMMLETEKKQMAFLHVSCTEWKNLFSMEIYGEKGKLEISGLGGSYGTERITWFRMLPEMGPPETTIWEYPMADNSWEVELSDFFDDIVFDRNPSCSLYDARAALSIIEQIYEDSGYDYLA